MNSHFASQFPCFCVANLRNSLLLRAIRRLESGKLRYKLFRPELIRGSIKSKKSSYPQINGNKRK